MAKKLALIIGNYEYVDSTLPKISTPQEDVKIFADVLRNQQIGKFDEVIELVNPDELTARLAISEFFTQKQHDDLLLLYFSGHGLLDDRGRLYLAVRNTSSKHLKATGVPDSFVAELMDESRSKLKILILDCCYSGAFNQHAKGTKDAVSETTFMGEKNGHGRIVLTASSSTEQAYEGKAVQDISMSLFTHYLVEGLVTGDADLNGDGRISVNEWYDYTYKKITNVFPEQTPRIWTYNREGDIVLAFNFSLIHKLTERLNYGPAYLGGYALLIGVGADLPVSVTDATGIAEILTDPERCAYPENQVTLLTGKQATRANIFAALDSLAKQTTKESRVIVYFSGHGYYAHSAVDQAIYLMPNGYDLDNLSQTAISGIELIDKLRAIPSERLLILLDCCHAGGIVDFSPSKLELSKIQSLPENQPLLLGKRGYIVISASHPDEVSYTGVPYSQFTQAIIEALAGAGASKQDGYVRVIDLAMYAREIVPQYTKGRQRPVVDFEQADNFVISYYAGGKAQVVKN